MTDDKRPLPGELLAAAQQGRIDEVASLLDRGADIHERNQFGNTPLHWAAMNGHVDVVKLLLDRGADINARNDHVGATPLMRAAGAGKAAVVTLLLDRGAQIDVVSKTGFTAADYAASQKQTQIVEMLAREKTARRQRQQHRLHQLSRQAPKLKQRKGPAA